AQPLVLERPELVEVGVGRDLRPRIPSGARRPFQPERASGFRVEVPLHNLAHPLIERVPGAGQRRVVGCLRKGHPGMLVQSAPFEDAAAWMRAASFTYARPA